MQPSMKAVEFCLQIDRREQGEDHPAEASIKAASERLLCQKILALEKLKRGFLGRGSSVLFQH
jgi:hypothetical protein